MVGREEWRNLYLQWNSRYAEEKQRSKRRENDKFTESYLCLACKAVMEGEGVRKYHFSGVHKLLNSLELKI